jgi:hypothetical protein
VKSRLVPTLLAFLLLALTVRTLLAASVTLTPVADTTLFETTPDFNMGASSLAVGSTAHGLGARALLRFDVSAIPSNATITSVTLSFSVFRTPLSGGQPSLFGVHRFLKPWVEGTGSGNAGSPAAMGETTWRSQFQSVALWSQPGTQADADYMAAPGSTVSVSDMGGYTFATTPELVGDVQAWVSGTATNHGWIMISAQEDTPETARRIYSREDPSPPPQLQIEYTTQPNDPVPQITSAGAANSMFELRFTVPSTYCYEVEYRDSLAGGTWSALTNICAPVSDVPAIAKDSLSSPQRFYRLRVSGRVR